VYVVRTDIPWCKQFNNGIPILNNVHVWNQNVENCIMHENKIKFLYLLMSSIVLLLALAFNQYDLAFMTAFMGFVVASA